VYNNQATLPEALGLAGDLTYNGNRKNIKLIRQSTTGVEVVLLDLTDPNLIKSPYFYMQPNDMIYVQPLRAQLTRTNLGLLGTVFGAISATFIILN
jgi:polysaccharide export outer membrane protein